MIRRHKILMIVTSVLILLPILAGVILWDRLPEQIATHFGANGEPDGWSSREVAVFGFPLFLLALHWICVLVTSADPKQKNIGRKMNGLVFWMVPAVSCFTTLNLYGYALGGSPDVNLIVSCFLGVLFIVIGNYLPKCRQNYTVGLKVPWTLADEENWTRTHRLAGWIWMGAGVLMLLTAFLHSMVLTLVILLIAAWVPVVYSYLLWRKKNR